MSTALEVGPLAGYLFTVCFGPMHGSARGFPEPGQQGAKLPYHDPVYNLAWHFSM